MEREEGEWGEEIRDPLSIALVGQEQAARAMPEGTIAKYLSCWISDKQQRQLQTSSSFSSRYSAVQPPPLPPPAAGWLLVNPPFPSSVCFQKSPGKRDPRYLSTPRFVCLPVF